MTLRGIDCPHCGHTLFQQRDMARGVPRRQREVLDFVVGYMAANKIAPTYSEIAAGCDMRRRSQVAACLDGLGARGLVTHTKERRSIEVTPMGLAIYSHAEVAHAD